MNCLTKLIKSDTLKEEVKVKFVFGDIVVVDEIYIGVVVKSWISNSRGNTYEVYVRSYNKIVEYEESKIERYLVRHKELSKTEIFYQNSALGQ